MTAEQLYDIEFADIADEQDMCTESDGFAVTHVLITCGCDLPLCGAHLAHLKTALIGLRSDNTLHASCTAHHVSGLTADDFTILNT
jgi:hypothetical protein